MRQAMNAAKDIQDQIAKGVRTIDIPAVSEEGCVVCCAVCAVWACAGVRAPLLFFACLGVVELGITR